MSEETERYNLLTRLAAYSGCSLEFGIVGFIDNVIVLSTVTHLHHMPAGKTLLEVADHVHAVLLTHAADAYEIPDNIVWSRFVTPGVCMN